MKFMEASRLRLEASHLTKISIIPRENADVTPVGQFADFNNANMSSEVTLQGLDNAEKNDIKHALQLQVLVSPKSDCHFPYDIDVSILGVFDANELPAEKRDVLVLVNGASMLYSALREMLLTLTYRCIHGPVMLPSVHFAKLAKDYEDDRDAQVRHEAERSDKG